MHKFPLSTRVVLLTWSVIMWLLSLLASYIGYVSTKEYLAFPDAMTYSTGLISLTLSAFIMLPFCLSGIYCFLKGQRMIDKYQRAAMIIILAGFFLSIIYGFSFKFFFINKVNDKGYYSCAGIPTGWMPGMATKYVISKDLCNKSK